MLVVLALQQALARWVFRNQGAAPTQRKTGTKKGPKKGPKKDKRAPKEKEAIEEFVLTEGMEGEVVNPEIAVAFLGPTGPRIATAAAVAILGPVLYFDGSRSWGQELRRRPPSQFLALGVVEKFIRGVFVFQKILFQGVGGAHIELFR